MSLVLLLSLPFAALYGGPLLHAPPTPGRALVKTAAVASLAAGAVALGAPGLLVAALALSSLGDWFLAGEGEPRFLAGLVSFLIAHLALIALFWSFGMAPAAALAVAWRVAAALAGVGLGLAMLVWLWPSLGAMRAPVAVYTAAIVGMVVSALLLGAQWLAIPGAFAFAVSDSCLAAGKFRLRGGWLAERALPAAVWWLYWAAQAMIFAAFAR